MKVLIFAFLLVVAVTASLLKEQGEKFQAFKLKHNKNYKNQAEETKRFNIFKENLVSIEQHNALYEQGLSSYKLGVNQFTDLTQEEFGATLTLRPSNKLYFNATKHVKSELVVPDSIDWRTKGQVTGVKDQGSCGSCWSFSIIGSVEAAYYRKYEQLVSLSEQQLVDCTTDINYGCGGGYIDKTFSYVQQCGVESEDIYPYTGKDDGCKYSASKVVAKISEFKIIDAKDEDALYDAVGNIGPVSVTMNAMYLSSYESGIFDNPNCNPNSLNHAVLIVGYGTENGKCYWIVKNSWGSTWGENGYFRIVRGQNECGIAQDTVYPTCN